jgi:octopine/nopaline transport system ATP-binding protein
MSDGQSHPAVAVNDLHKYFGALHVIKGVSFAIAPGNVTTFIGSSGSGKSTLLRCLNLLETPDSGSVSINGEELRIGHRRGAPVALDRRQVERVRSSIGMVFQSFNLWSHMTVLENLIEAPIQVQKRSRGEAIDEAMALLERVGLAEKRDVYPAFLSGGQQQRAGIARALAVRPSLLLFDEPTSALDPELVGEVLNVIRDLAQEGRTMVLVTHEMGFAADVSNRVVFLADGQVEEDGPPERVLRDPTSRRCAAFISGHLDRSAKQN